MKTPKFILNRTEDYLYHSKLWIIGYASLFYLCSIIIFSMLLTFCVFIYNCIGLDPETMTNFGGDLTYLKKSNDNLHFLLSVLVTAPLCEELIFRLGLSSKTENFLPMGRSPTRHHSLVFYTERFSSYISIIRIWSINSNITISFYR